MSRAVNIAQGAIHSLFDNALRGWPGFVNPDEVPANRVDKAREYGTTRSPIELQALLSGAAAVTYLSAPYHGDLHADNVRVRGNDAILIDFQRVRTGPLLADHACLEISLAFNEYPGDSNEGWTSLIDTLFSDVNFAHPPGPPLEPAPREWIWNAVRQIRTIALANQRSHSEYLQIVAISLLRFARLPARSTDTPIAEVRKAYAYVIANRLTNAVTVHA